MSIPGRDNESPEQRRKLNRENQRASAKGNKSVVSRAGGSEQQEPQMRSVNELQVTAVQQGMHLPAAERTVKSKKTTPVQLEARDTSKFDSAKATEQMEKSDWLTKLNNDAKAVEDEYKGKSERASKYAKAAAWGNLFSALGQLAGGGMNTYVRPESKYLTDALSKADKAREVYDAIKASNKKSITDAKAKWLANEEKRFYDIQKAYNEGVDKRNDAAIKLALANTDESTVKYNNSDLYKQQELGIKRQSANAATKRAEIAEKNAELNQVKANQKAKSDSDKARNSAYINFKDRSIGKDYYLNESEALEVANKMIASGEYTGQKLGLLSSYISGTLQDTDRTQLKSSILDYLETNKDKPEIASILNTAQYGTFELGEEDDL